MKYILPMKVEIDLEPKAHKSDKSKHIKQILHLVKNEKDRIFTSRELISIVGMAGSVYGALYRLAITQQIEFYCKKYHCMPSTVDGSFVVRSCGDRGMLYPVKPDWRDEPRPEAKQETTLIPTTPTPIEHPAPKHTKVQAHQGKTQQPLWVPVEGMSIDELTNLIERAEKARLERMLDDRYDGADFVVREQVFDVLRDYGVADPVALAHQKGEVGLLTATAIEGMPIVVTIGTEEGASTVQCKHISLHGAPLVLALARAYRLASGKDQ